MSTEAGFKLGGYIRVKDLEALLKLPDQSCRWGLRAWVKDIGKFYIFKPVRNRLEQGGVVRGSWVRDTSR